MLGDHDGIGAGTFGRAGYGAEVAHVGDAVEHHHEGEHALLEELRHKMVETVIGHGRHHGYHALMVLARDAVEALHGHTLGHHAVSADLVEELRGEIAREVFADKHFIYLFAGFDGFHHGADAENIIGGLHNLSFGGNLGGNLNGL